MAGESFLSGKIVSFVDKCLRKFVYVPTSQSEPILRLRRAEQG